MNNEKTPKIEFLHATYFPGQRMIENNVHILKETAVNYKPVVAQWIIN